MPKHDAVHFDQYREQNRAKHGILRQYLAPYLQALSRHVERYHYIDGFAGRGLYASKHPGSPLIALDILGERGFASRSTISCVECREDFANELCAAVKAHPIASQLYEPALVRQGRFQDHADEILSRPISQQRGRTAHFAFIDPCGVEGVRMTDMVRLLRCDCAEILLFFNYDAVNRLLGAYQAGTINERVLVDLFGSQEALVELMDLRRQRGDDVEPDAVVRNHFIQCLKRQSGIQYFVPFRFDAADKNRPSHDLIHCTGHRLGFKIMKHVMWETGRSEGEAYGRLQFLHDRERGQQFPLFLEDVAAQKELIGERVCQQPCKVEEFSINWMYRPNDPFSEKMYKTMITELEAAGRLRVYDKLNAEPKPPHKRPRKPNSQERSLADGLWLRPGPNA